MRYWRGRIPLFHHWQAVLAVLAMASLPFVFPASSKPQEITDLGPWLKRAEYHQRSENHARVKAIMDYLLARAPEAKTHPQVHFLRAGAILGLVEEQRESTSAIPHALHPLQAFRKGREQAYEDLFLEAAELYSKGGQHQEAIDLYGSLEGSSLETTRKKVARALPLEYAMLTPPLKEQSLKLLQKYESELSRPDRAEFLLLKAQVLDRFGHYQENIEVLTDLERTRPSATLYLQRGLAHKHLKQWDRARMDFEKARDVLKVQEFPPDDLLDSVHYELLDVYRETNRPEIESLAFRLLHDRASMGPLVYLTLGQYYLVRDSARALETLRSGLEPTERIHLFRVYGFDFPAMRTRLRGAWLQETEGERVRDFENFLNTLTRFVDENPSLIAEPDEAAKLIQDLTEDRAEIFHKLALKYRKEARSAAGDRVEDVARFDQAARTHFLHAALRYEGLARLFKKGSAGQLAAYRSAAEMHFEGGYYLKAAEFYRLLSALTSAGRPEHLFRQAMALKHAMVYEVPDPETPDALKVLDLCMQYPPEDPIYREALLEKGKILLALARYDQAAQEFRKILDDEEGKLRLTPADERFKQALFHYGLASYHRVRRQVPDPASPSALKLSTVQRSLVEDARGTFLQFLERYSTDLDPGERPHPLCMRAAYYAAMIYKMDGRWDLARAYFEKAVSLGKTHPQAMDAEEKVAFKHAHFYSADMTYLMGHFSEAIRAYDAAYKDYSAEKERIWGLIGKGRCLLKLDKKKEADEVFQEARQVIQEHAGQGISKEAEVAVWISALDELQRQ